MAGANVAPSERIEKLFRNSLTMFKFICVCGLFCVSTVFGQELTTLDKPNLHNGLAEKIGNFSIELLYDNTERQQQNMNMIMSPVTAWSLLAVIAEGAAGTTLQEICYALRINPKKRAETREDFQKIFQWLQVKTNTVELERFNAIFVDARKLPLRDFADVAKEYDARMVVDNFTDTERITNVINHAISTVTRGRISTIVTPEDLSNTHMIMTSVLYFKGQWTAPFNASLTRQQKFYSSTGEVLGEVNMMYRRYTYPFAYMKSLQARVIEIPYGKENRLSMVIMLPNPGVSLKEMFYNFNNVSLDAMFKELKLSVEQFGEDEVDLYLPRFKIESSLDLTESLKWMGIHDLFDETRSYLPLISRTPLFATKVIHKAEIEVTEEGTTASAVSVAEFSNRISATRFEANRPFCYLIIEKVTNSIAFGGFYRVPSVY